MKIPLLDKFENDGREVWGTIKGRIIAQFKDMLSILVVIEKAPGYCPSSFAVIGSPVVGPGIEFLLELTFLL